jgi:hypothetical protein
LVAQLVAAVTADIKIALPKILRKWLSTLSLNPLTLFIGARHRADVQRGTVLAWTMAKAGHRTAVVERRWIGGSCPNIACLPSKDVIWSAKVASLSGRGPEFGLPSASTVDMAAVRRRKRKLVEDMVNVHLDPAR